MRNGAGAIRTRDTLAGTPDFKTDTAHRRIAVDCGGLRVLDEDARKGRGGLIRLYAPAAAGESQSGHTSAASTAVPEGGAA